MDQETDPFQPEVRDLPRLLAEVREARTRVDEERCSRSALYPRVVGARLALLATLEAYTSALAASGRPVPYRLRDELFLCRRLRGRV